jgi:hypothetical protein
VWISKWVALTLFLTKQSIKLGNYDLLHVPGRKKNNHVFCDFCSTYYLSALTLAHSGTVFTSNLCRKEAKIWKRPRPTPLKLTTQLAPWSKVLIEKPIVAQPVEKFPTFHGNRKLVTVFTRASHSSWVIWIQSTPSQELATAHESYESSPHPHTLFP